MRTTRQIAIKQIMLRSLSALALGIASHSALAGQVSPVAKLAAKKQASTKAAVATSPTTRAPASIGSTPHADPNQAVEIRGQSRTLSMMLVLKNGKENINFIKVRKDYKPEILATQY